MGVAAQKGNLSCVSRLAAAGALSSSSATPAGDTLVDRFLYKLSFPFAKKEGEPEDVAPGGCTG